MKFIITSVAVLLLCGVVSAGVVTVPSDYTTLEQALLATSQCDTILLEPGTYAGSGFESLSVDGRCVTIMSQNPLSRATIVVGDTTFMYVSDTENVGNGPVDFKYVNFRNGRRVLELGPYADIGLRNCKFDTVSSVVFSSYLGVSGYQLRGTIDSCWFEVCGRTIEVFDCSFDFDISNNVFLNCLRAVHFVLVIDGRIFNNTIAHSTGYEALYLYASSGFELTNNTILWSDREGIADDNLSSNVTYLCNNFFQNRNNTFNFPPDGTLDSGNVTLDPQFCDPNLSTIGVMPTSPLLPENNICNTLIGNVHVGCVCGDVNNSGQVDVVDLTDLVGYLFQGQPPLPSPGATNIDGIWGPGGPIDVADLTRFVWWLYQGGPTPLCFES